MAKIFPFSSRLFNRFNAMTSVNNVIAECQASEEISKSLIYNIEKIIIECNDIELLSKFVFSLNNSNAMTIAARIIYNEKFLNERIPLSFRLEWAKLVTEITDFVLIPENISADEKLNLRIVKGMIEGLSGRNRK